MNRTDNFIFYIDYIDFLEQKMFYERIIKDKYPYDFCSVSAIENLTNPRFYYADEELELDLKVPDQKLIQSRTTKPTPPYFITTSDGKIKREFSRPIGRN